MPVVLTTVINNRSVYFLSVRVKARNDMVSSGRVPAAQLDLPGRTGKSAPLAATLPLRQPSPRRPFEHGRCLFKSPTAPLTAASRTTACSPKARRRRCQSAVPSLTAFVRRTGAACLAGARQTTPLRGAVGLRRDGGERPGGSACGALL